MWRWIAIVAAVAASLTPVVGFDPASAANGLPDPIRITGVDAHDGMVYKVGSTYYLVGTAYGCGFQWDPGGAATEFCGFSVYQSSNARDWQFVRMLFDPNSQNTWASMSWQRMCGGQGDGCFNPRMIQRPDGVWILAFNAPFDYRRGMLNAYYFMGCNSPAGPCGEHAGGAHGTTHKPLMQVCTGIGDFSIVDMGERGPWIICTLHDQTLASEKLDASWVNGTGVGRTLLAKQRSVEGPGVAMVDGRMTLMFSQPHCGYCSGTGTGWAIRAPSGRFLYKGKVSTTSCNGQPRSLSYIDGRPWLWIDQWTAGQRNQTNAPIVLTPVGKDNTGSRDIRCPPIL